MGIFKNLRSRFRNEAVQNSGPIVITTTSGADEIAEFFGRNQDDEKLRSATYYACMQIRCNSLAKLPLKVMKTDGDNTLVDTQHQLYRLLHDRPNPYMSAHDFLWQTEYERLGYGNAFWLPVDDGKGRIVEIYPLRASRVSIMIDDVGVLSEQKNAVYYVYSDSKDGPIPFKSDEILHFKHFALDGIKGTPVAQYLADVVGNERRSTKVMKDKYESGLHDPILVQYVGDLGDAKQQQIKNKFARLGGAENAGKVIPIPTDFKVDQLETKLVNSQFFQLQGLTSKHIANAFGVKSFQLNDLDRSTYTNIENQNRSFYSDTLINVLREYEQEMWFKLFRSDEKNDHFCQFNVDAFLRSDPESRYKNYQTGISGGFLTIAEVRKMEDLPHIEGTDGLIYGNGAAIKIDQIGAQYGVGDAVKGGDNE